MNAEYLHKACHDAVCECPQFKPLHPDTWLNGYGRFGDIPKLGLHTTFKFWREFGKELFWGLTYFDLLPADVKKLFSDVFRVEKQAAENYCNSLEGK